MTYNPLLTNIGGKELYNKLVINLHNVEIIIGN